MLLYTRIPAKVSPDVFGVYQCRSRAWSKMASKTCDILSEVQIHRGCSVALKAYAFTNEASDSHCKSN